MMDKRKKKKSISIFICLGESSWPEFQSRPQLVVQAAILMELRQVASALHCQGDFKSQSPEPWDSRETS